VSFFSENFDCGDYPDGAAVARSCQHFHGFLLSVGDVPPGRAVLLSERHLWITRSSGHGWCCCWFYVRSHGMSRDFLDLDHDGLCVKFPFSFQGRFDNRIPFLIFGILCVSCAFLTFSLPVDDFAEKLVLDLQEYVEDRDVNNNVEQLDEEELVFEPLPEMTRSPYVL
jgi:hypothetical protein